MIRLAGIVKEFRVPPWRSPETRVRALDGVDLEVAAGEAVAIVGPNGAGKSTLLRILLGYVKPTEGEVSIAGQDPRRYAERHGIGYVPENPAMPGGWRVRQALEAFAALGEVDAPAAAVDAMLEAFDLHTLAQRPVRALSRGNLQKLAIAQALVAPRKLLILDEPLNALDPVWVARLRVVLREWRAADPERALLLVSHNLPEAERTADRAAILADGRIRAEVPIPVVDGTLEERFLALAGAA